MVLSAVHNVSGDRGPVCEIFSKRMAAVRDKFNIETLIVGSEGDLSRHITEHYGHHYVEFPNKPVSKKFVVGLKKLQEFNPTHVIIIQSDDIVSDSLFEHYISILSESNIDVLGIHDIYFLGLHTKRWGFGVCGYWAGRNNNFMLGVARCFSSSLLDKCNWNLWETDRNSGIDGEASAAIKRVKSTHEVLAKTISIRDNNHLVIDIKTNGNISSMSNFELEMEDYADLFTKHLPTAEAKYLIGYCKDRIENNATRR